MTKNFFLAGAKWWYGENFTEAFEADVMPYTVCGILDTVNHSCNFLLYVISGSLFRSEFIAMITCQTQKDVNSKGMSNATSTKMPHTFSTPLLSKSVTLAVHKSASTKTSPSHSMISLPLRKSPTTSLPSLRDTSPGKAKLALMYHIQPPS